MSARKVAGSKNRFENNNNSTPHPIWAYPQISQQKALKTSNHVWNQLLSHGSNW